MLTVERVRHLFTYDEERGILLRNFKRGKAPAGSHSTCTDRDGYLVVGIDSKIYRAHRVIWLYKTGQWPRGDIDHIDRDPANNRWCNLRDVTRAENKQNQVAKRGSKSGVKGVSWSAQMNRWVASITVNGKTHYLGASKTIDAAAAAYAAAAAVLHKFNPSAKVG